MTSINKELEAAKAAKAVISTLSATKRSSLTPLHHAYRIAVLHLSNEGPLNEARQKRRSCALRFNPQPTDSREDRQGQERGCGVD
jgi:hypothetical protein